MSLNFEPGGLKLNRTYFSKHHKYNNTTKTVKVGKTSRLNRAFKT